jgi:hypothetical protein
MKTVMDIKTSDKCYRHCQPTDREDARPMTGSAKQSILPRKAGWIASSLRCSQ